MSWMQMSREGGQKLADALSEGRPNVGTFVKVVYGRKHIGKTGKVFWHGPDKYSQSNRYGSPFQQSCSNICGTYGFRVGIITAEGEKFFVPAENVRVE